MKNLTRKRPDFPEIVTILILAFCWNQGAYFGARLISRLFIHPQNALDMTVPADLLVPFRPWTVLPYFACYLFWAANYYMSSKQDADARNRFFCADFLGKIVCFVIFLALPTTNVRPEITDNGFWGLLMRLLYWIDSADNLFPSVHCFVSWMCWIGVRSRKDISVLYRYLSLIFALATCVVVLTTRQHVIWDAISGVVLAELCYLTCGLKKLPALYGKLVSCLAKIVKKVLPGQK